MHLFSPIGKLLLIFEPLYKLVPVLCLPLLYAGAAGVVGLPAGAQGGAHGGLRGGDIGQSVKIHIRYLCKVYIQYQTNNYISVSFQN